ncbi:cytochrome c maturation protein CcmE [Legionella jordanis]|uniref:Cytochrome c-type biogenesis protein CcmE n=1 Tax=Legionella jordanis TaxID=456 RepID=A0A0W0VFJ6_9GAMM|nr:cytochrome c maturation protein CcmE [Legionella jordanis]KTD18881.1 cytochrome c-type biogenesis protein CcmE [Legionella jordanis]RMX05549.1 cytochrome c maturation protein CcmE [Legionella jordanis]VEH12981.1 cytochrome c-type biogenesis protein CcmE [Legionella jordanis]
MNPVRKRKMLMLVFIVSILAMAAALVLYALRQNISLFYSPSQVIAGEAPANHNIRLGGMVVKGSIIRSKKDLAIQFKLTDFKEEVTVYYRGILPDLFREGQGVVAMGKLSDAHQFQASQILAKHDANYMPPEVKQSLANAKQNGEKSST